MRSRRTRISWFCSGVRGRQVAATRSPQHRRPARGSGAAAKYRRAGSGPAADFFTDALPSADVYVLMEIIHDWEDADAIRILSNIRRSAPDGAMVLIIETVLDDRRDRDPAKTLDIVMMSLTGGRERTPGLTIRRTCGCW